MQSIERPGEREVRDRLALVAWLLDSSIPLPGTRLTIGLDALVGLLPFAGDLLGVLASSYILAEAQRLGVSRAVMARMAFNVAIEGIVGVVPFAGDAFDAVWKANQRNVRLINDWLDRPHRAERGSRMFVLLLIFGIALLAAGCLSLTWLSVRWLLG